MSKWAEPEDRILKNNYKTLSYREIAKLLGNRSYAAVKNRCLRLGLDSGRKGFQPADYTNQKFGFLTAVRIVPTQKLDNSKTPTWECFCDCSPDTIVYRSAAQLREPYGKARHCGNREIHGAYLRYPIAPTPYPEEAAKIVSKYLDLTKPKHSITIDQELEDLRLEKLMRAAWILTYRRSKGEIISERYERAYIWNWLYYSRIQVHRYRLVARNGDGNYTRYKIKRIGDEMTNETFRFEAVSTKGKTQPELICSTPKRRIKFKRC